MREAIGDLWTMGVPVICVTTNGSFVRVGSHRYRGVMGRGVALQAKQRYPHLEDMLGMSMRDVGNHVAILRERDDAEVDRTVLVSFPVKHQWHERDDPTLIERSCYELMAKVVEYQWRDVLLPRPGCGNGGLVWSDVGEICYRILGDQVTVVTTP